MSYQGKKNIPRITVSPPVAPCRPREGWLGCHWRARSGPGGNRDPARSECWSAAVSLAGTAGATLGAATLGFEEIKTKRKTLNTDAENFGLFVLFYCRERMAHGAP